MNRILKSILTAVVLGIFFITLNSPAYAKPNPAGWFKGEKKGWEGGEMPPGLSKKEAKKAEKEARKAEKKAAKETKKANKKAKKKSDEAAEEAKKKAEEAGEEVNKAAVSATQATQ